MSLFVCNFAIFEPSPTLMITALSQFLMRKDLFLHKTASKENAFSTLFVEIGRLLPFRLSQYLSKIIIAMFELLLARPNLINYSIRQVSYLTHTLYNEIG